MVGDRELLWNTEGALKDRGLLKEPTHAWKGLQKEEHTTRKALIVTQYLRRWNSDW